MTTETPTANDYYEYTDQEVHDLMNPLKIGESWRLGDTYPEKVGLVLSHIFVGLGYAAVYVIWRPLELRARRRCKESGHDWQWYWPTTASGPDDEPSLRHYCIRCSVSGEFIGHTGHE